MQLLFKLSGLYIFGVHFQLHVMSQCNPNFFIFCVCNALSLSYMRYESDGNDMLATGGVTTFVH